VEAGAIGHNMRRKKKNLDIRENKGRTEMALIPIVVGETGF
jgi:hypothetical protein